jgi:hypothetical protein
MTLRGRRDINCREDRATLESVPSALQGHRQPAAPDLFPGHRFSFLRIGTPGGGCYFRPNPSRCLAPKANTPGPAGAEQLPGTEAAL